MAYVGWELDQSEMEGLRAIFVPKYPDVVGHHITHTFGVGEDFPLPEEVTGDLYGYVNQDGVEALIVEINGTTVRPDGRHFHITWSIDREAGKKPQHSNDAIANSAWEPLPLRVKITLRPKYFP